MVKRIIQVIKRDFPKLCGTCRNDYTEKDASQAVTCNVCKVRGHRGCHTDNLADEDIGVVWICVSCTDDIVGSASNLSSIETLKANPFYCDQLEICDKNSQLEQEQPQHLAYKDSSHGSRSVDRLSMREVGQEDETPGKSLMSQYLSKEKMNTAAADQSQSVKVNNEEGEKICPKLLEGICPYGWSGMSGVGCTLYHPKRCQRYCSFGKSEPHGCNKDKCDRFHPKLCQNSVLQRKCFNDDCRRLHLEGTARHRPRKAPPSPAQYNPKVTEKVPVKEVSTVPETLPPSNTLTPHVIPKDKRKTKFIPQKPVQKSYYDPISFLVLRLETLKSHLARMNKEMEIVQNRLQEVHQTPRTDHLGQAGRYRVKTNQPQIRPVTTK